MLEKAKHFANRYLTRSDLRHLHRRVVRARCGGATAAKIRRVVWHFLTEALSPEQKSNWGWKKANSGWIFIGFNFNYGTSPISGVQLNDFGPMKRMHNFLKCLLSVGLPIAFIGLSASALHVDEPGKSLQKIGKLRDSLCAANSLRKYAKQVDAYCMAQQQKMTKFFVKSANLSTENGCLCADGRCSCCADLNLDFCLVHVHNNICLDFAYLAKSLAIEVAVVVDGRDVFNITLSAINPPPLCLPFFVGSFCFKFYNLKVSGYSFSGCVLFEMLMFHEKVVHEKLGCFKIPVPIPSAAEFKAAHRKLLIVFCDCAAAVQQQQLIRPCSFTDELNGFYASWHTNCSGLVNFVINSYNFPRPKVPSAASGFPAFSPPFTNFWIGIGFRLVSTELIMVENQANGGVLISQARVEPDRLPQRQIGHGILLNPRGSFVGGTTLEATFSIDESLLRGCKEFLFFAMPTPLDVPFAAIPPPHVREVCELGRMCARFPCPPVGGGGGFGGPVGMMDFIGTGGPQDPTMPMTLMNDIGSMNPSILNGYGNKFGPNGYRFGPGSYGSGYGGNGYYGGGYGSTYGAGSGLNPYGSGGGFYSGAALPYSMYWPQSPSLQYPMMGGGTPLQYSSQNPYSTGYWGGFMNNVFPLQHLPVFTAPPDSPTPATVLQVPFTVTVPTFELCTKSIYCDLLATV
uniref:DUF4773 domain-containing protein n=1 Tax=Globodera rostochiensis TaxID=31243 RepID=A0A914GXT6_GLORO